MQKVEVYGDVPLARFGHTMTLGKLDLSFTDAIMKTS